MQNLEDYERLDEIMTKYFRRGYLGRLDEVEAFLLAYKDDISQMITPTEEDYYPDDAPAFPIDGKHFE